MPHHLPTFSTGSSEEKDQEIKTLRSLSADSEVYKTIISGVAAASTTYHSVNLNILTPKRSRGLSAGGMGIRRLQDSEINRYFADPISVS